ncbi:MAG TPA: protein phosphatase CheZ [Alphaproteobacteria bacterium]|nr:protein phosphatase CheZ [Alphaproteobacteria bacterium]
MTESNLTSVQSMPLPQSAVDMVELHDQIMQFQAFVKRRFDEISMEINATSQQMDMAEDTTAKKFGEIFEVLDAISYKGEGTTAANTGVELDAVVAMTEQAANTILDAAGNITNLTCNEANWASEDARKAALGAINAHVEEIIMACAFQDLTGQRIRKTLENVKNAEDKLGKALERMGIHVKHADDKVIEAQNHASTQGEIDNIFSN